MVASLVNIIRSRRVVWRVDATGGLLEVQRRKGYCVPREEQPPQAGAKLRIYETDRGNRTRMVSPERVVKLSRRHPAEQAEDFLQALRAKLTTCRGHRS